KSPHAGIPLDYVTRLHMFTGTALALSFYLAAGIVALFRASNAKHVYQYTVVNRGDCADMIVGSHVVMLVGFLCSIAVCVAITAIEVALMPVIASVSMGVAISIIVSQVVLTLISIIVFHRFGRIGIHSFRRYDYGYVQVNLGCRYYSQLRGSFVVEDASCIQLSIQPDPGSKDMVHIVVTNEKCWDGKGALGAVRYVPICLAPSFAATLKSWIATPLSNAGSMPHRAEDL
ncbi:MAG: hypothetical protein H7210_09595, partial [Pyrinomonadaceae bacterium]|nr:hypothetical protein [Phycisphaerales bacterium]